MSTIHKLLASIAIALLTVSPVSAAPDKIKVRKIVRFNANVSAESRRSILARLDGESIYDLDVVSSQAALLPPSVLGVVRSEPGVLSVEDDAVVTASQLFFLRRRAPSPSATLNNTTQSIPWGVDRIGADQAWTTDTGAAIKVGIIDSGIDPNHPDLKRNIAGGVNIVRPSQEPLDDNGHGTHVAGIVAAVNNNTGVVGVGPQVALYAIKVLGSNGSGYVSDIIKGLDWAISNHMNVVNMSLGTAANISAFHDAVARANQAGIIEVAAAGNDNGGAVNYPAAYPEAIAVSATTPSDLLASFSSTGPQVALAAPGVNIPSTYIGSSYRTLSGTSMAAPHVTGAAALLLATPNCRNCSPSQVLNRLESTADDKGPQGRDNQFGYGIVNVMRAISY